MTKPRLLTCCSLLLISQVSLSADVHDSNLPSSPTPETVSRKIDKAPPNTSLELLKERLRERNYLVESDDSGHVKKIILARKSARHQGRIHLASPTGKVAARLPRYLPSYSVPAAYRNTPSGSVNRISLSADKLGKLHKNDRLELNLPGGKKQVLVQDAAYRDGKGGLIWTGHLDQNPDAGRTVLSLDRNGAEGQIMTPQSLYRVESRNGATWLVDVGAAGLEVARFHADESSPANASVKVLRGPTIRYRHASESDYASKATLSPSGLAIIDLVVGYTPSLADNDFQRKLRLLIALANQAYRDSKINISLRLADTQVIDYPDESNNDKALNDLTEGQGNLQTLQNLKQKTNADTVVLLRSFVPSLQGGCGSAWVNGSNGTPMSPDHAYAVVSLGTGGNQYCSSYTLAHEMGHILGATHDAAHSSTAGRFPYSYGYGIEGRFGDIMSYYSPETGIFSNPTIVACDGLPCGIPDQADVAKTFNATARTVSGFGSIE